jgi:hypothetical protein
VIEVDCTSALLAGTVILKLQFLAWHHTALLKSGIDSVTNQTGLAESVCRHNVRLSFETLEDLIPQ